MAFLPYIRKTNGIKVKPTDLRCRISKDMALLIPGEYAPKIKPCTKVTLFFDSDQGVIGVKPVKRVAGGQSTVNTYVAYKPAVGNVYGLGLGGFLKYFNIKNAEKNTYPIKWNGKTKMFEINLKKPEPLQIYSRTKKTKSDNRRGSDHATSGEREEALQQRI